MYRPTASIRTEARAPKSMPWPGTTGILAIRSARLLFPAARRAAIACSAVVPAGSRFPMTPVKMMSVASPMIFGPMTRKATLVTPSPMTATTFRRSGLRRLISRRTEGPKVMGFSAGMPPPPQGPPPKGPRAGGRGVGLIAERTLVGGRSLSRRGSGASGAAQRDGSSGIARSCGGRGGLAGHDLDVRRTALEQLPMGAETDDGPVVKDDDLIGSRDSGDALADDHNGGLCGAWTERSTQPRIGGQVKSRERIVEEVDLGLPYQRAGD